jgi:2-polyprenyl-3-methyl-5-hydroxy-6-metoxy-1,4-benzoquinol methylase
MFKQAENYFTTYDYEAAAVLYTKLIMDNAFAPFAYYRLAAIVNITHDANTAESMYYKAFNLKPDLCKILMQDNHPNKGYVFSGKKHEEIVPGCPLCCKVGNAHWCYVLLEMGSSHVQMYNPVRVWMHCTQCHHIYAKEFPVNVVNKNTNINPPKAMPTKHILFSYYSEIITKLGRFTQGNDLLEIGIGGSECVLAAQEMGYDVLGIDIVENNVAQAKKYGIDAIAIDFINFDSDKKWDIIIMGDVIEHVSDPVVVMKKVYSLLTQNGVVWISTPNFDAAFSKLAGHNDPMRREAGHKNYFSRNSIFKLFEITGFAPVEYKISAHYNGSMEIICVKK